jgi:hypothetical protein
VKSIYNCQTSDVDDCKQEWEKHSSKKSTIFWDVTLWSRFAKYFKEIISELKNKPNRQLAVCLLSLQLCSSE